MEATTQTIFEKLRTWRNQEAIAQMTEPYMIFQNKVLQSIADAKPKTLEELSSIKGIGQKKISRYGKVVLDLINQENSPKKDQDEKNGEKVFSVSEYVSVLNQVLVSQKAIILGEITSVDLRERYIFFSLKDKTEDVLLKCFVWKDRVDSLGIELKEGMEIQVVGFPRIYPKYGTLSFEVNLIGLVGEGELKLAFENLKKKLDYEGFFAEERKKEIPEYVENIGVISSTYGDAIKDFNTHLGNFGLTINFFDVRVEGMYSIDDIISAIHWFNENMPTIEVLILIRGGGSLESLQAFNSEPVARAIFSSRIPIVTGVGHENDITIADLVADKRASTPTAAARLLSDPWRNSHDLLNSIHSNMLSLLFQSIKALNNQIHSYDTVLTDHTQKIISSQWQRLDSVQTLLGSQFKNLLTETKQIQSQFMNNWTKLEHQKESHNHKLQSHESFLLFAVNQWFNKFSGQLLTLEEKLELGNPEKKLKQGYSIIKDGQNKVVKDKSQIKLGDNLKLKFYKGSARSTVTEIKDYD